MSNIFFGSDWHLNHFDIMELTNRPFSTVEEMNQTIIDNHNSIVGKNDFFYFLGDFCFGSKGEIINFMKQLNGKIYYIYGNHDKKNRNVYKHIDNVIWSGDLMEIKVDKQPITLCHYPMVVFNKSHFGAWQLYGHVHRDVSDKISGKKMNMCVDLYDFKPVSFEEVREFMATRDNNWDTIIKGRK